MFYIWIIVSALVGGFAGVVAMSMMFVAKNADRRIQNENCNKAKCNGGCKGWNVCDDKW